MSSYTSSFSPEWKVIGALLGLLAAGEAVLRVGEARLSKDVRHILEIPRIVGRVERGDAPRVVFLGNSLTREAVRANVIAETWSAAGLSAASVGVIFPDDTTLLDWYYVYRRHIETRLTYLDLLVVNFANDQLDDANVVHLDRLGSQFAGFRHVPEVFAHDATTLGDRVDFLLSAGALTWAHRGRVQNRVLALLPGYRSYSQVINEVLRRKSSHATVSGQARSFNRLNRFLAAARARNTAIVFVAMPTSGVYPLPGQLRGIIEEGGGHLLDLRTVEGIGEEDFPDGFHLSRTAAPRFSRHLAKAIAVTAGVGAVLSRSAAASN